MRIRYREPTGEFEKAKDPLPENWRELEQNSGRYPYNFHVVEEGKLYRSGVVFPKHIPTLQSEYGIGNIITFLEGEWLKGYDDDPNVTIHQFPTYERNELTNKLTNYIVDLINDLEEPSLVSCRKGRTRTGKLCVTYKMRNFQQGRIKSMVEIMRYGNFNPSTLLEILFMDVKGHDSRDHSDLPYKRV